MEGRLSWEEKKRTTPVGTKVSLHPATESRHITRLCYHEFGEPVKTSHADQPQQIMGLVSLVSG